MSRTDHPADRQAANREKKARKARHGMRMAGRSIRLLAQLRLKRAPARAKRSRKSR
jgi:hypothetical protein